MDTDVISKLSRGASFFRGDLHIHSFGASHDVTDTDATPQNIVETAANEGLSIIALADHNEIANVRIAVEAGVKIGMLVIPGVELSTPEGHLLCYAPTVDELEKFFNKLSIAGRRSADCRCQTGTVECLNYLREVGGLAVLAHVELPGAFEANMPRFNPAKLDILCHPVLAGIEVTRADCPITYNHADPDSDRKAAASQRVSRLNLGSQQCLARIMNSDAHTLTAVGRNARNDQRITRYKMEVPTFEGLRLALSGAETRVRLEEEIPAAVPTIEGVHFSGCFLDGQAIHFSSNLTCIIGGRGSGKSTAFEGLRMIGNRYAPEAQSVVDSDVWPDCLTVLYRDETREAHLLTRNKNGQVENDDDPIFGPVAFPIESYRQGETNELSKQIQDDPLALLTFLDRLVAVKSAIEKEDEAREKLNQTAPEIKKARGYVLRIPDAEKDLKLKQDQVTRLKNDKAEDVIKLQQKLESEKRARNTVETLISQLVGKLGVDALTNLTKGIRESVQASAIELGAPEAATIQKETADYEVSLSNSSESMKVLTSAYIKKIKESIVAWRTKESEISKNIESKKNELLAHGIQLDMLFIKKLVADEAKAAETLRILKTWVPELRRLNKVHDELLAERWAARAQVVSLRTAFAIRASAALKGTLSDLFVTLKFEANALSPIAESLISDAMGWRTLQQLKAGALIKVLTLPKLLECIKRKSVNELLALRNDKDAAVFSQNEAELVLERLGEHELLSQLEAVAVYDAPRLNVTKRIDEPNQNAKYVPRDFKRLSLGQQQSVLLALMLTSESSDPLIVDQPEDNLDSEFIYKTLLPVIRAAKEKRQIIVVTHNANIAVLGDAEQIVVLRATNEKATIVARGSIDEAETNKSACAILEGSPEAFERRAQIYGLT